MSQVVVTARKYVPFLAQPKQLEYTVRSRFVAPDDSGQRAVFRYLDHNGSEANFYIPKRVVLDLNKDIDRHNYHTLLKHLEVDYDLQGVVAVEDSDKEAREFVVKENLIIGIKHSLKVLYDTQNFEQLRALYRRRYISAEGKTDDFIYQTLIKFAEQQPEEFDKIMKDGNFDILSLIDKAVEAKIFTKDGELYKTVDGKMVANSTDMLVFNIQSDKDLKATIEKMLDGKRAVAPIKNPLTAKLQKSYIAEPVADSLIPEEELADAVTGMSKEVTLHTVMVAVKTKYIEGKDGEYLVSSKGVKFSRRDLDDFYIKNPNEAFRLKSELEGAGLWIEQ